MVLGGQRGRQRADRGDERRDVRILTLEYLDDLGSQLVNVAGREGLEQRLEAVEQHCEVERGRGSRQRNRSAGPERAADRPGPLPKLDIPLADQIQVLDRRRSRGGPWPALLQRESNQGEVGAVGRKRGKLAGPPASQGPVLAPPHPRQRGEPGPGAYAR